MTGIQTRRRLAQRLQCLLQRHQAGHHRIESIAHLWHRQRTPLRATRRQPSIAERSASNACCNWSTGSCSADCAPPRRALRPGSRAQFLPRAHAEPFAEELRGQFGQLVRLVDDKGLRPRQQLTEAVLLQARSASSR
jgi:hypothetical protein